MPGPGKPRLRISLDPSRCLYCAQSSIDAEGFRSLREGETVEFFVETGEDGRMKAVKVTGPGGAPPQARSPLCAGADSLCIARRAAAGQTRLLCLVPEMQTYITSCAASALAPLHRRSARPGRAMPMQRPIGGPPSGLGRQLLLRARNARFDGPEARQVRRPPASRGRAGRAAEAVPGRARDGADGGTNGAAGDD